MKAALVQAQSGTGSVVLVEGPAGIGKTSVLRWAVEHATASGFAVLEARGTELQRTVAFGAIRRLLEAPVARVGDAAFAGPGAPARAVFEDVAVGPGAAPPDLRARMLLALTAVIGAVCQAEGPLLACVDDAQWLDRPSLEALAVLCPRVGGLPLAVVLGARDDAVGERGELARVAIDSAVRRLALAPLSRAGVAAVLAERLGREPPGDVVDACAEVTGGNPWYLSELAGRLDDDALDPETARRRAPVALAATLRSRVAAASPDGPAIARALVVLGDGTSLHRLAELAGVGMEGAAACIDALAAAGVLAPGLPPRFAHAIVFEAVQAGLAPAQLAVQQRHAARLVERDGEPPERVAAHLVLAPPAGEPWAVDVLLAAAAAAQRRGAPGRAAALLQRALDEPPPAARRAEVLALLGTAELAAGQGARAAEHLEQALELGAPGRLALVRALAQALASLGRTFDAIGVLERELDGHVHDADVRATLVADLAGIATVTPEASDRARERLASLGRVGGATPGERLVLAAQSRELLIEARDLDRTVDVALRALAGGRLADESNVWILWSYAVYALIVAGRLDEAREELDRALSTITRRASAGWYAVALALRADLSLRAGDIEGAEADARASLSASRDNELFALPAVVGTLVEALLERGRPEAAEAVLTEHRCTEALPEHLLFFPAMHARGRLRIASGATAAGVDDLLELRRRHARWGVRTPCAQPWRVDAVRGLRRLGRDAEAVALAAEQGELAATWPTPMATALGRLAHGLVQDDREAARESFAAAAAAAGEAAPLARIEALVEEGRAIRQAGRRAEARAPLREALSAALEAGARRLAHEAEAELRAARGRPPRREAASVALTPSEARIAELAAAGMSNREIAASLFVTVRTVETHLTSAYRRLGISSRHQLADALAAAHSAVELRA